MIYTDEFLSALGLWQSGWSENKNERLARSESLKNAINALPTLPPEALQVSKWCYRKRFLVPNNPQNGGDFWPFFWDGEIVEGLASWSTDYNYCKVIFKPEPRPNTVACIFRRQPKQGEIVLNIAGLWSVADFIKAVEAFIAKGGPAAKGLSHFRDTQSEVILDAPLSIDEAFAFCGRIPALEQLCEAAEIQAPDDEDELWRRLVQANYLETMPYWIEGDASLRAIDRALEVIREQLNKHLAGRAS